jgi:hypothetical protein
MQFLVVSAVGDHFVRWNGSELVSFFICGRIESKKQEPILRSSSYNASAVKKYTSTDGAF